MNGLSWNLRGHLAAGSLLLSAVAFGSGERIAVLAADPDVNSQLSGMLCVSEECVDADTLVTAGKPDFAKVAAADLTAVVVGRLVKTGGACTLEVQVLSRTGAERLSRKVPADATGKVSMTAAVTAGSAVIATIERPESQDAKPAKAKKAKLATKAKRSWRKVAARAASGRGRG